MADPSNRVGFFWCSNGVGLQGQCSDGEFFFEDDQACGFDETTARPGPPGPPTRPPPTTRNPVTSTPLIPTAPPHPPSPCTDVPDNVRQLVSFKSMNHSQLHCRPMSLIHQIAEATSGVKTVWHIQENVSKAKSSSMKGNTVMLT